MIHTRTPPTPRPRACGAILIFYQLPLCLILIPSQPLHTPIILELVGLVRNCISHDIASSYYLPEAEYTVELDGLRLSIDPHSFFHQNRRVSCQPTAIPTPAQAPVLTVSVHHFPLVPLAQMLA